MITPYVSPLQCGASPVAVKLACWSGPIECSTLVSVPTTSSLLRS